MSPVIGTYNIIRTHVSGVILRLQIVTAICLSVALLGTSAAAPARKSSELDVVRIFNIPAQPLDKALLQFGAQAHVQLSVSLDSTKASHVTRALNGAYTGQQALADLLDGTGLKYAVHGFTVEIHRREVVRPTRPGRSRGKSHVSTQSVSPKSSSDPAPGTSDSSAARDRESQGWLREIIVTAQKYSQREFDVPIDLQVVSGSQLSAHGIANLRNLQYDVPGLYMNSTGLNSAVYLRGVGDTFGNGAMVGQYIDDADITSETLSGGSGYNTGDNGLYDLQRVEILKGPQGTLYGDGSMGGVIRYITNKPELDAFQMSADVAALFTEYGAPGQRIESMFNVPLVPGTFAIRLAGMSEHDGGWVDEPAANAQNINGSNLADLRIEALYEPTSRIKFNAMQIIHRHTFGDGAGEDANGNVTPLFNTTLVPHGAENSRITNLTVTYDFDTVQILSSSTYLKDNEDMYDVFEPEHLSLATYWGMLPHLRSHTEDSSEELRLVHIGMGTWRWTIGAFYKQFKSLYATDEYFGLPGSTLASAQYYPTVTEPSASNSWAGFVDTSYRFFNRLTLGLGGRYFKDRDTESEPPYIPSEAATFTSTDPRFYAQYRFTSHINAYASASKGFRSGGFNYPTYLPNYLPDSLWSYDLGTKLRLPAEGVRADVDIFYEDYSNFLTEAYTAPYYIATNIGKARIEGIDADLTWRPTEMWRLTLVTEALNTKFLTGSAITGYLAGDRLPYAPTYSFTESVLRKFRWYHRLGDVEVYYYQISPVQYRTAGFPLEQSDVLRFLNARASIRWSNDLQFGLFAHNLLNERGIESPAALLGLSVRPRPRTFGIEFTANFGSF